MWVNVNLKINLFDPFRQCADSHPPCRLFTQTMSTLDTYPRSCPLSPTKAKLRESSHSLCWTCCRSTTWVSITVTMAASPPLPALRPWSGLSMRSPSTSPGHRLVSPVTSKLWTTKASWLTDCPPPPPSWLSSPRRSSPRRRMQSRSHLCRTTSGTSIPPTAAAFSCPKMPNASQHRPHARSGRLQPGSCFSSFSSPDFNMHAWRRWWCPSEEPGFLLPPLSLPPSSVHPFRTNKRDNWTPHYPQCITIVGILCLNEGATLEQ